MVWITFFGSGFQILRSSHQRYSVKKVLLEISQNSQENTCTRVSFLIKLQASDKGVRKNFAKFTGKHLRWSIFFKVTDLKACSLINFIKKVTTALMFSCEFCEPFKNTFSVKHLRTAAFVNILMKSWKSFKIYLTLSKRSFLTPLVPRFLRFLFTTNWSTLKLTSVFTIPEKI